MVTDFASETLDTLQTAVGIEGLGKIYFFLPISRHIKSESINAKLCFINPNKLLIRTPPN